VAAGSSSTLIASSTRHDVAASTFRTVSGVFAGDTSSTASSCASCSALVSAPSSYKRAQRPPDGAWRAEGGAAKGVHLSATCCQAVVGSCLLACTRVRERGRSVKQSACGGGACVAVHAPWTWRRRRRRRRGARRGAAAQGTPPCGAAPSLRGAWLARTAAGCARARDGVSSGSTHARARASAPGVSAGAARGKRRAASRVGAFRSAHQRYTSDCAHAASTPARSARQSRHAATTPPRKQHARSSF
jgi:hypothetical protein